MPSQARVYVSRIFPPDDSLHRRSMCIPITVARKSGNFNDHGENKEAMGS